MTAHEGTGTGLGGGSGEGVALGSGLGEGVGVRLAISDGLGLEVTAVPGFPQAASIRTAASAPPSLTAGYNGVFLGTLRI
jgi:hypothetical protein